MADYPRAERRLSCPTPRAINLKLPLRIAASIFSDGSYVYRVIDDTRPGAFISLDRAVALSFYRAREKVLNMESGFKIEEC